MTSFRLYGNPVSRRGLASVLGWPEHLVGSELLVHADGPERGLRVVRMHSGAIELDVLPDRGLDILQARVGGIPVGWRSPAPLAGPWLADPSGYGPLRTFSGGLLTTCGLDHIGEPTEDDISQYGYPGLAREQFGLHGRLSFTPARLDAYGVDWEAESPCAFVQGTMRQGRLLGESLSLRRRISVPLGSGEITISDEISNDGFAASPHLLLYHVNAGWPLVQERARIAATVGAPSLCPEGYDSEAWRVVGGPAGPHRWDHDVRPIDGRAGAAILCDDIGDGRTLGLELWWTASSLPYFQQWHVLLGNGHNVVALEPSTLHVSGRVAARAAGVLDVIEPGAVRTHELVLSLLHGGEEIAAAETRLSASASNQKGSPT